MKGIVFTVFLDMVEDKFGEDVVEDIIDNAELESGGAYTSVGSYPAEEMRQLVHQLSIKSELPMGSLLESFGHVLFKGLNQAYPHFFTETDLFKFLSSIHTYIHVEVKKLYSDAELPSLIVLNHTDQQLVLLYESPRRMGDLARGLLNASIEHYKEDIDMKEEQLDEDGVQVRFTLNKK